ncbi:MAG: hypothetical protein RL514_3134 [Verrucomicrobiota bacterium]|jgi:hypothetical protein
MSHPLPPLQQESKAWEALRAFGAGDRTRGEDYFRQGRVLGVSCAVPGTHYQADVEGGEVYLVDWEFEDGKWFSSCTCPMESGCKHAYATLKTLLLSPTSEATGVVTPAGAPKPASKRAFSISPLADQLRDAVGRELTREEIAYLTKVHNTAARVTSSGSIHPADFTTLGLTPAAQQAYQPLKIWPSTPKDEHEFWLYLAHATQLAGGAIPKFMEPVTDLAKVSDRIRRWQRGREVEEWNRRLHELSDDDVPTDATAATDLRVRLSQIGADLEWKRPGATEFEALKSTAYARLTDHLNLGQATLHPDVEILWQAYRGRYSSMGIQSRIHVRDVDAARTLGFLLRTPQMRDRIVTPTGAAYAWGTEPLRWQLTPAENDDGDYLLRLTLADGQDMPAVLFVVSGSPVLYVGETTIFPGPPLVPGIVDPTRENRIPAAAFERTEGVALLRRLGLELPARLSQRVEQRPLRLRITASLRPLSQFSKSEECVVRVNAFSTDGAVLEHWTPTGWGTERHPLPKAKADPAIVFYDRAALAAVPALMAPLDCKFDRFQGQLTKRVTKKFPDEFAAWLCTVPSEVELKLDGELASFAESAIAGTVQLEATEAGTDWFDLRVIVNVADTKLTPAEIKLLLSAKGGFVRLADKGWRKLEFKLTDEEDEQLARLGLTSRELTDEPQRLHALQLADPAAKKFLPEAQTQAIQRRATELKTRVAPPLPAALKAELRPYQLEGFHFLAYLAENNFGGILADDMGLGKTLQTLAWLLWLRSRSASPQTHPSLVVCPKSVTDNWRAEVERFAPGLRVKIWHGTDAANLPSLTNTADLHVLNYTQLRLVGESLARTDFQAVILDEGQYIKNPSSQTAQIARALRAEHRLVLSGTPIENRLLDLWSLMSFAMPGVLGSRAQFGQLYDAKEDPHARRRLSARVRPFLLRRTKTQVARDLPDRVEEDLYCEIEGEQKTLYRAELKRAQQMLLKVSTQKQLNKDRFHFLTSLLRLRQICCHPKLVKADSKAESAKLEALLEQLEPLMEEGHKVLVFSQFVSLLDLLKEALTEKGWPVHYLAGDTENRGDVVREFQAQAGGGVFLISLKAGGFGLNLTAASYVVLFDPWWNPAVEAQAIDRTHRIGQTQKVIAYRLLIKDSIEEKIRALQKTKSALAEDVLGEEKFAQALTLDDLRFLFAD